MDCVVFNLIGGEEENNLFFLGVMYVHVHLKKFFCLNFKFKPRRKASAVINFI